jgi:APA family basic amino acid/polyamine antiporter
VGFGIAVIVGNTIGSGILLTPGEVAGRLGDPRLVFAVWTIGGIFALFCTLSVIELGTMLPQAGGWLVYSRRAFGEYGGFLVGCCDWMTQSSAIAYLAAAFSEFTAELNPALQGQKKLVAVSCVVVLTLLNLLGLRTGSRTQEITSLVKGLGLMIFVAASFFATPGVPLSHSAGQQSLLHLPPITMLIAIVATLQPIIVTYDGWQGAIYFTEEDTDPARNLPRSSLFGVVACGALFLLVNAALLHVLSVDRLGVASMPAADAAELALGSHGRQAILLLSMLTVVSTMNASLLISPRILFAMAREKLMPGWVASVNTGGTPSGALLLCAAASILLVLSGGFETLIAISSILFVAVYLSGFLSLSVLRMREPGLTRPFKMWGYPWSNFAICAGTGAFLLAAIFADFKHALFTVVLILLTYPLYRLIRKTAQTHTADAAAIPLIPEPGED